MKKIGYLFLFILYNHAAMGQTDSLSCNCPGMAKKGKGTFYITAGYQLDWFSKSTIHLNSHGSGNFNFTLYDVRAVDRPGLQDLLHEDITIPQYSFRIGYWFNNKKDIGIELNYDHVKYVVVQHQVVRMKGSINSVCPTDQKPSVINSFQLILGNES